MTSSDPTAGGIRLTPSGKFPAIHTDRDLGLMVPICVIDEAAEAQGNVTPDDIAVSNEAGLALMKHYPGHPWLVWCSHMQGILVIRHMAEPKYGYVIHLENGTLKNPYYQTPRHRIPAEVMKAGGEILERAGVKRGMFRREDMQKLVIEKPIKGRVD